MTENQLIKGCIDNDRLSQKYLYDKYSGQMHSICLRYCHDSASAADALQIGFIKVFQNIKGLQDVATLGGWIRKIIVRSAIDQIKKEKSLRYTALDDVNEDVYSYDIDIDFDHFNYNQLIRLIDDLPEGYKLVFTMFVLDELTHKEIAESLNISENTSRSQLYKARKLIQDALKKKRTLELGSIRQIRE